MICACVEHYIVPWINCGFSISTAGIKADTLQNSFRLQTSQASVQVARMSDYFNYAVHNEKKPRNDKFFDDYLCFSI